MDGGDRTGGQRRQGALGLILEGGRADGAHAVHGSGGRLGGGQAACIAHRDGHGAGEQVAGAQGIGAGDGGNGAGQGLKGTVQRHVRALPHRETGCVCRRELQCQCHLGVVADHGHFLAAGHLVALGDLQAAHDTGHFRAHILAVHRLVVVALGLLQGDARLLHLGGSVGGVHGVEHIALFHVVAFLKAAGQHLAGHQRFDIISIRRLQGAGAAQGIDEVPLFRRGLHIAGIHAGRLVGLGLEQPHTAQHGHAGHRDQPLPVLFQEPGCSGTGRFPSLRRSRSVLLGFLFHRSS